MLMGLPLSCNIEQSKETDRAASAQTIGRNQKVEYRQATRKEPGALGQESAAKIKHSAKPVDRWESQRYNQ